MKIRTEKLKELLGLAIKGASNDNLVPISQFIGIKKEADNIMLTSSDGNNYLYVTDTIEDSGDNISVAVYMEQFSKLISKITSEFVSLEIKNDALEVKGNGTYMLELHLDETTGEFIVYPDPASDYDVTPDKTLSKDVVRIMIDSMKSSIATTQERPILTNYYVGESVITSNREQIALYDSPVFDENVVMPPRLVDLLGLITTDAKYYVDDSVIIFSGDNIKIFSRRGNNVSEYPVDLIKQIASSSYKSECKVNKNDFIALLERMSLLVGKYDDRAVKLYFEKDGIKVTNRGLNSDETIKYQSSKKYKQYDCEINVDMLLSQLKAYSGDIVEIHYNSDATIKFVSGDLSQIIALIGA